MTSDFFITSLTKYYTEGPTAGASVSYFVDTPPTGLTLGEKKQYLIKLLVERKEPTGLYSLDIYSLKTDRTEQIKIWFVKH